MDRALFDEVVGVEDEHKAALEGVRAGQGRGLDLAWGKWKDSHKVPEGGPGEDDYEDGEEGA